MFRKLTDEENERVMRRLISAVDVIGEYNERLEYFLGRRTPPPECNLYQQETDFFLCVLLVCVVIYMIRHLS